MARKRKSRHSKLVPSRSTLKKHSSNAASRDWEDDDGSSISIHSPDRSGLDTSSHSHRRRKKRSKHSAVSYSYDPDKLGPDSGSNRGRQRRSKHSAVPFETAKLRLDSGSSKSPKSKSKISAMSTDTDKLGTDSGSIRKKKSKQSTGTLRELGSGSDTDLEGGGSDTRKDNEKATKPSVSFSFVGGAGNPNAGEKSSRVREDGYSRAAMRSFAPLQAVMILFGRFPFQIKRNSVDHYEVVFNRWHWNNLYFLLVSTILTLQAVLFGVNCFSLLTNFPEIRAKQIPDYYNQDPDYRGLVIFREPRLPNYVQDQIWDETKSENHSMVLRAEERYLFHRNLNAFIIIMCVYLQAAVGCCIVFYRRRYVAHFLTLMFEASNIARMDMSHGVGRSMWYMVFLMGMTFVAVKFCASFLEHIPIAGGLVTMLITNTWRVFYPPIHTIRHNVFMLFKIVHACILYMAFITGKVYVLVFIWCCRLIHNGFKTLNARLELALLTTEEIERTEYEKMVHRTSYAQMFSDHVLLLDLIEGVDRMFKGIMEFFVLTELMDLCFKFYYVLKCLASQDQKEIADRRQDMILIVIFMAHSILLLHNIIVSAADINYEADEALEILRQRGLIGEKSPGELQFLLSMYLSHSGHFDIAVVCGNYIKFNRRAGVFLFTTFFVFVIIIVELNLKYRLTEKKALLLLQCYCRIPVEHPLSEQCGCYASGPTGDKKQGFTKNVILWQTESGTAKHIYGQE